MDIDMKFIRNNQENTNNLIPAVAESIHTCAKKATYDYLNAQEIYVTRLFANGYNKKSGNDED